MPSISPQLAFLKGQTYGQYLARAYPYTDPARFCVEVAQRDYSFDQIAASNFTSGCISTA